ncbi:hypothetical protein DFS34DRAFT_628369 [Phlyctochytrium arcticum]|nr:hypothetical protein DFS34DRAFT_628369 [Phlyctochytrium arcticum]
MGTDEAFADVAAAQDDYIPFDFDDDPFIDQLDGPGPASEAQAVAETKTPKNKQPTVRPDTAPAPRDGRHGQHAPNSDPRGRREPQSKLRSVDVLYPLPVPPWQPEDRVYSKNLLKMLHQEINDYVAFLVPTDAEHIMRQLTVERIRHVVSTIWPHAGVSVFGSFETKLYLPTSDVDIVILEQSIHNPKIALEQLRNAIRQAGIASKIEVISGAKVPILKMVDALTFYPADISFNIATGVDAAKIVRQFIDDPLYGEGLRPLLLIMKQFLLQRNLNEVFTGGIGSYTLMSMITAFLRMHPKLQTGQIHAKDNLGILLMEFLDLYGNRLNYEAVGIGLNLQRAWFFPKAHYSRPGCCPFPRGPPRPNALCILDPQDATNEIGGASRAWPVIRREFIRAYTLLGSMIGAGYEKRQAGRPFNVTTLLGSILTVRRETMEHREKVQQRYESIQENLVDYVIKGTYDGDPVPGQKRKREVTPESTSSQQHTPITNRTRNVRPYK